MNARGNHTQLHAGILAEIRKVQECADDPIDMTGLMSCTEEQLADLIEQMSTPVFTLSHLHSPVLQQQARGWLIKRAVKKGSKVSASTHIAVHLRNAAGEERNLDVTCLSIVRLVGRLCTDKYPGWKSTAGDKVMDTRAQCVTH